MGRAQPEDGDVRILSVMHSPDDVRGFGPQRSPRYGLRAIRVEDAMALLKKFHAYRGAGTVATYALGAFSPAGDLAAAFLWQPPPPGAAKSVCPEAPHAVLALSRMVALPREERPWLKHISKALKVVMRDVIDRGRYPVLITYSDEGAGHTGYVYQCSGWEAGPREERPTYTGPDGERVSSYSNGRHRAAELRRDGSTWITRWEDWACERGAAAEHVRAAGWVRVRVAGNWRSGAPKHKWMRERAA